MSEFPGLSVMICFGRYAGWWAACRPTEIRITAGWFSLTISRRDMDRQITALARMALSGGEPRKGAE